ncbi:MAG: hypothetical protein IPK82_20720 [Polyangiaceae bacterium]|nr:hypothetical protein [Polyangiaceae bacterium]
MRLLPLVRGLVLVGATALAFAPTALFSDVAYAQQKGGVTPLIQRAAELFDDQQYEESIQTLSAALLRPGSSTREKIEIYRLLAYNYITLKRTDEADSAVRGLYVIDESFVLPATESPRFREFFEATRKKWVEEGKPGKSAETSGAPAEAPVKVTHSSPAQVEPGTTIKLSGSVDDPNGRVRGVQLFYRAGTKGKFKIVAGTYTLGKFNTQIPGKDVVPPLVEYYLEAVDNGGLPVASRGDVSTPLRIVVPEPQKSGVFSSPAFWIPVGAVVVGAAVGIPLGFAFLGPKQTATVRVGIK